MTTPREMVGRQIAAYNDHDVTAFVACYAQSARVLSSDGTVVVASGRDAIGSHYAAVFQRGPSVHAEIQNRIEVGMFVIVEELVTNFVPLGGSPTDVRAAVAYRVADGLIDQAQLII